MGCCSSHVTRDVVRASDPLSREISLLPDANVDDEMNKMEPGEIDFESVDQIVTDQITKLDTETYKPNLLLDIYRGL